jgi:hypothetical protein
VPKVRTSFALAHAAFLATLGRSGVLGHDFLEDLAQVGRGAGLGSQASEGRKLLHVGLKFVGISECIL